MSAEITVGGRRQIALRPWMALLIALSLAALSASVLCHIAYSLCYQAAASQARLDATETMKDHDALLLSYRQALEIYAPHVVCVPANAATLSCSTRRIHPVVSKTPPTGRVERNNTVY